jgi:hypothetical protein
MPRSGRNVYGPVSLALSLVATVILIVSEFVRELRTHRTLGLGAATTLLLAIIVGFIAVRKGREASAKGRRAGAAGVTLAVVVAVLFIVPYRNHYGVLRVEQFQRAECAEGLRRLGAGLASYAAAHGGRYPERLSILCIENYVRFGDMRCPSRREPLTIDALMTSVDNPQDPLGDRLYFGRGMTSSAPADSIIVCEKAANHRVGAHVLYRDGRVVWMDATTIARIEANSRRLE